jgi:hypothetical protein
MWSEDALNSSNQYAKDTSQLSQPHPPAGKDEIHFFYGVVVN